MPKDVANICLIGDKFMGRAHSNAFMKVDKFFNPPMRPVMHTVVGRNQDELDAFKNRWGWKNSETNWEKAIKNPEINLVDVTSPNNAHAEMAIAALEAGKNVACEKPLAGSLDDARCGAEEQESTLVGVVCLSAGAGGGAGVSTGAGGEAWEDSACAGLLSS